MKLSAYIDRKLFKEDLLIGTIIALHSGPFMDGLQQVFKLRS